MLYVSATGCVESPVTHTIDTVVNKWSKYEAFDVASCEIGKLSRNDPTKITIAKLEAILFGMELFLNKKRSIFVPPILIKNTTQIKRAEYIDILLFLFVNYNHYYFFNAKTLFHYLIFFCFTKEFII